MFLQILKDDTMMRNLLIVLLLASFSYAEFLLGLDNSTSKASVRCDGQREILVAAGSGEQLAIPLDDGFQATFAVDAEKSYAVQCGKATKTIQARPAAHAAEKIRADEDSIMLLLALAVVGAFAAAAAIAAKLFVLDSTEFSKTVENGRATLRIKAGKLMQKIEVSDPVSLDFPGEPMKFAIPILEQGRSWSWSYDCPGNAARSLPASLRAEMSGSIFTMISDLFAEGQGSQASAEEKKAPERRMVPKAD